MKRLLRLSMLALVLTALACGAESDPLGTNNTTATDGGTTDGGTSAPSCAAESMRHTSIEPAAGTPSDAARLIVFGDSISAGQGAPQGRAYFDLLSGSELATFYGHAVPVVNVAVGGSTTANLAAQVTNLKSQLPAPVSGHSIIVVTIGGNDVVRSFGTDPAGTPLTNAEQKIRSFIASLQDPAWFPDGTTILLANVYDPSDGVGQAAECLGGFNFSAQTNALPTWAERYAAVARDLGVGVVDALGHFRGHGFHSDDSANPYYQSSDPTLWFANDCIHPNERGHSELRRLFYEALDCTFLATP